MSCIDGYRSVGGWCYPDLGGTPYPDPDFEHGGEGGDGGDVGNIVLTGSGGGTTAQTNTLNQILQALLSGFAIQQHQPYVPTQIQPAPYGTAATSADQLALIRALQLQGGGSTTGGKIELWIKNNTGVTLMLVAGAALFFMKPPPGTALKRF